MRRNNALVLSLVLRVHIDETRYYGFTLHVYHTVGPSRVAITNAVYAAAFYQDRSALNNLSVVQGDDSRAGKRDRSGWQRPGHAQFHLGGVGFFRIRMV